MAKLLEVPTGQRFGSLTVVGPSPSVKGKSYWRVLCDCGEQASKRSAHLVRGSVLSCGCGRVKHGGHGSPLYRLWRGIVTRCLNPKHVHYARYGGRGITVCDRWKDFANFREDIGPRPSPLHEIDREDNNGNYEPGNCHWATKKENARNRRNNVLVICGGREVTIAEAAELSGINYHTIRMRVLRGQSDIFRPVKP